MASGNEVFREGLRSALDSDLVHLAAQRAVEQSAVDQLTTVPLVNGMAEGIEFLLREPLPGELPEDDPGDLVLDALRDELRNRIAQRYPARGDSTNG